MLLDKLILTSLVDNSLLKVIQAFPVEIAKSFHIDFVANTKLLLDFEKNTTEQIKLQKFYGFIS